MGARLDALLELTRAAEHGMAARSEFTDVQWSRDGIVGASMQHGGADSVFAGAGDAQHVLLGRVAKRLEEWATFRRHQLCIDEQDVRGERLGKHGGCLWIGRSTHAETAGTEAGHGDVVADRCLRLRSGCVVQDLFQGPC